MSDLARADFAPCPVVAVLLALASPLEEPDLVAEDDAGNTASAPVSPLIVLGRNERLPREGHRMRASSGLRLEHARGGELGLLSAARVTASAARACATSHNTHEIGRFIQCHLQTDSSRCRMYMYCRA